MIAPARCTAGMFLDMWVPCGLLTDTKLCLLRRDAPYGILPWSWTIAVFTLTEHHSFPKVLADYALFDAALHAKWNFYLKLGP